MTNQHRQPLCLLIVLVLGLFGATPVQAHAGGIAAAGSRPEANAITPVDLISVPAQMDLQSAINKIKDGGVVELAGGTYSTPSGGFELSNLGKSLTIRAAGGAQVTLDGGSSRQLFRAVNNSLAAGKAVVFENLVFANGFSQTAPYAAGFTLIRGNASFIGCQFTNNRASAGGNSAGGVAVFDGSTVFFVNSTFSGNSSNTFGGAIDISNGSKVYIHNSRFTNNRVNLPGHISYAAGGAIHLGNALLRVSNTVFDGNQAGYVGGAIYAIGTWGNPITADVIVANSTFTNNRAARDPGVGSVGPTEGGAFHAEDQASAQIYSSRFYQNSADIGGGVNAYRASIVIEGSEFRGNRATGSGSANGFGAAISLTSNDGNDASTNGGQINRPNASLTIRDSLIQGQDSGVSVVGQVAGGIYATGDQNSMYGMNGVAQKGTLADNRAKVVIDRVIFNQLFVQEIPNVGGTGTGGAMTFDLVDLSLSNSVVMNSKAIGSTNSSGGGLAILDQTVAAISNSSFYRNSADKFGGAIFAQGSTLNVSGSRFVQNSNPAGYGAALFSAPMDGRGLPVNGQVQSSVFSNNSPGMTLFDDDRTNGPIDAVVYNNNQFYLSGSSNPTIYKNSIGGIGSFTPSGLNSLVVNRANGTSTDKGSGNSASSSVPVGGDLLPAPPAILPVRAWGESSLSTTWLGYGWTGSSATLDGNLLPDGAGVVSAGAGSHTLSVGGNNYPISISWAAQPNLVLNANPGGTVTTLSWTVSGGTFLDAAIDQGISIPSAATGSVQVSNPAGMIYQLYAISKEGGAVLSSADGPPSLWAPGSILVLAGKNIPVNTGYLPIRNDGGGILEWTASGQPGNPFTITTPSGSTGVNGAVAFTINTSGMKPGNEYTGSVQVDGGPAGSATVVVTIRYINTLYLNRLPIITH